MAHERILVVDDEESMRRVLGVLLSREGYSVETASSGVEALRQLDQTAFDLVICDIRMSGQDGFSVLRKIREREAPPKVILMTAFGTVDTAIEAIREGACDYFSKPIKANEMILRVRKALQETRLEQENVRLREAVEEKYSFHNIVGKSPAMLEIFEKIKRVGAYKSTVLITGESGTGKELIARALHYHSPRAAGPFVAINCGAIPSELLESELFGHEKGSFTGAVATKKGLFEEANGGAIFLDEIGEIPAAFQIKLLRVLQEEEIRRVGGKDTMKVDVRVMAATEKDLAEEIARGNFRESLYYRLNVVPIHLPPLRARKEDIPLLAQHFVDKLCAHAGKPRMTLQPGAIEMLLNYNWPGNIRELENTMERAVIMTDGTEIREGDLPPNLKESSSAVTVVIPEHLLDFKVVMGEVTAQAERQLILRALQHMDQNRTRAAEVLGISQRSLLYKIKEYGIE